MVVNLTSPEALCLDTAAFVGVTISFLMLLVIAFITIIFLWLRWVLPSFCFRRSWSNGYLQDTSNRQEEPAVGVATLAAHTLVIQTPPPPAMCHLCIEIFAPCIYHYAHVTHASEALVASDL